MEIKAKNLVIWLVLLLIGLSMIVGPVVAQNCKGNSPQLPTVKTLDSKVPIATKITNVDKNKKVKDSNNCKMEKKFKKDKKNNQDNSINIKSHPVLKSTTGGSGISTMVLRPYRPPGVYFNMTV